MTVLAPASSESAIRLASLPGELTLTSYRLPDDLPFDHWEEIGRTLNAIGKAVQWWIGDWLRYGEQRYGERYAQAIEATGYDYGSLRNMVYVAENVPVSRRREALSWSHHAEVASLSPEQQEEILDAAEAQQMTREQVRARASEAKGRPAVTRLTFELDARALEPLREIVSRRGCSDEEAVTQALIYYARHLRENPTNA